MEIQSCRRPEDWQLQITEYASPLRETCIGHTKRIMAIVRMEMLAGQWWQLAQTRHSTMERAEQEAFKIRAVQQSLSFGVPGSVNFA